MRTTESVQHGMIAAKEQRHASIPEAALFD
jgi:hypothetical protein